MVQERYGAPSQVLEYRDVERPSPGDGEVLVRVRAAAIAGDDWHLMRGEPYVARLELGLLRPKPRIPGTDVAGIVEACGPGVRGLGPDDEVFGWCHGAFAEYVCTSADTLVKKPTSLSFAEAAALPTTGLTALQALRDGGGIEPARSVLIIGASGGVGTLAVQIGKGLGAEVTAVCSTRNVELVRSLGATHVIDYTRSDFTRSGRSFDVIVYLAGNRSVSECKRVLAPDGTLVLVGGSGGRWLGGVARWLTAAAAAPFTRQKLSPFVHSKNHADLETLTDLVKAGTLRPILGARYPFEDVVRAIRHFEAGHGTGKVVLTMNGDAST